MLHVLHVIGPLTTGGAQTQLLGLLRAAHGTHWNATVVATSGGPLVPEFEALGCPFIRLRRRATPGLLRMRKLRQIVASGNIDVVHSNLWQCNLHARVAVLGRHDRPGVVISERNVEVYRSRSRRWLDHRLASVTDAYVGNTSAVAEFIGRAHPVTDQQVLSIPNAVDRSIFHPSEAAESGSDASIKVGSVGRLDPEKGFDVLIEAVRLLVGDGRDVHLSIAGSGPLQEELKARATGLPISFVGRLKPGTAVADFLRAQDVFCLASTFREGRPNVLLEALACDLPVVATDIPGLGEVLEPEVLVPSGDASALASAIIRAAESPRAWKEASRATPVDSFDVLADRYLEVFKEAHERATNARS